MQGRLMAFAIVASVLSLSAFGVSGTVPVQGGQPAAQTDPVPGLAIIHGPYLQLPGSTFMTIVWHTNRKCVSRV